MPQRDFGAMWEKRRKYINPSTVLTKRLGSGYGSNGNTQNINASWSAGG